MKHAEIGDRTFKGIESGKNERSYRPLGAVEIVEIEIAFR